MHGSPLPIVHSAAWCAPRVAVQDPRVCCALALTTGALELLALSNVVWTIHRAGASCRPGAICAPTASPRSS